MTDAVVPQAVAPIAWNHDLPRKAPLTNWIWDGLLAPGNLTLLTSVWKSGKTTLVALLLDRRRAGGLLLNRAVQAGGTVVVSEEDIALWRQRQSRLDFGPNVGFLCRPYGGRVTPERWQALVQQLLDAHTERGVDLAVIDPLAMFLPGDENHAGALRGPLHDLQRLTRAGLAVLLLHHPRKGERALGQAARGSGALTACADILLEMHIPPGDPGTRRRKLYGFARHPQTPRRLLIELDHTGTDYIVYRDTENDDVFAFTLRVISAVLTAAAAPLTRQQILAAWPVDLPRPAPNHLWRLLARAVSLGLVERLGRGTKANAYRYKMREQPADKSR